jgi:hypothetical protein
MEHEQDPKETPDALADLDPADVPGEDDEWIGPPPDDLLSEEEPGYGA